MVTTSKRILLSSSSAGRVIDWQLCVALELGIPLHFGIPTHREYHMPSHEPNSPPRPTDSEARLRMLIDAAPVAMLVVDRNGRIVLVNQQAAKTFGYEYGELLGRGIDLLVPESLRRLHHLQVESFFHASVPRVMGSGREVLARHQDGREFPVEIGLTPIETSDGPQAMAAIIDVTERRRVETESTLARLVQQAMLPQTQPKFDGCDIFGASKPADATGGDFFDFIPIPGAVWESPSGMPAGTVLPRHC